MSFIGILLSFFLILWLLSIVLRPLLPRLLMWLVQRNMRRQMESAFGSQQQQKQQRSSGWPFGFGAKQQQPKRPRRRGKIFGRDVGEYVEFEEVRGTWTSPDPSASKFKPEAQVADAEWEDIC